MILKENKDLIILEFKQFLIELGYSEEDIGNTDIWVDDLGNAHIWSY